MEPLGADLSLFTANAAKGAIAPPDEWPSDADPSRRTANADKAPARGASAQGRALGHLFKNFLLLLCCLLALLPCSSFAATVNIPGFYGPAVTLPAANALPVLKPGGVQQGVQGIVNPTANELEIYQNQPNAIIDWSSFNIGANASVIFNQQGNSSWAALNRIWDSNPSLIFGKLTADGKIFLINQNGILFGPGSQVNTGGLVASALNILNSNFLDGVLNFYLENGQTTTDVDMSGNPYGYSGFTYPVGSSGNPDAAVSNFGQITAGPGGLVFLIGPRVENGGTISTSLGQAGLVAGTQVSLQAFPNQTALVVDVQSGAGPVWNYQGGQLISDEGMAGMYGSVVNQDGLIRSITAVTQNGQIELRATQQIITGPGSVTESPLSTSSYSANSTFSFSGGDISLGGIQSVGTGSGLTLLQTGTPPSLVWNQGTIEAPAGDIYMNASQRVLIDSGSTVSVAGAWSSAAATATVIDQQLNSVELNNDYTQKGGVLQGQYITTSLMAGSNIGDISGAIEAVQQTALEKGINGGTIKIASDGGDIIVKQGSTIDFSGGGINYIGAGLQGTMLLSGTTVYNISDAPLNIQYDAILGQFTETYARFGISKTYSGIYYGSASPLQEGPGFSFTTGGSAGSLSLAAGTVVLDGQLKGSATQGYFQTVNPSAAVIDPNTGDNLSLLEGVQTPVAGSLSIDTTSSDTTGALYGIIIQQANVPDSSALPANFNPVNSPALQQNTIISANTLNAASLGTLILTAEGAIRTGSGTQITLQPGGDFIAQGSSIVHAGTISVPAGTITLATVDPAANTPKTEGVFLEAGSLLDVSGQEVDNSMAGKVPGAPVSTTSQINGGLITLEDETAAGQGVSVAAGAGLDVSGGYSISTSGKIKAGNAGQLNIQAAAIALDGILMGYALPNATGGKITLHADNVYVTDDPSVVPAGQDNLVLPGNFFANTGFTQIELDSINNVTIGASISPSLVRLQTPVPAASAGSNIPAAPLETAGQPFSMNGYDLVSLDASTAYEAGSNSFTASAGTAFPWPLSTVVPNPAGQVTVSGTISMAPGGKITLNAAGDITVGGTLEALAGQINLNAGAGNLDIQSSGQILAPGYNRLDTSSALPGYGPNYDPVNGGTVTLNVGNGNLALESGSLIDISGSAPVNNTLLVGGQIVTYTQASNPGSLTLSCSGNLDLGLDIVDGKIVGPGSILKAAPKMAGIQGGTLTISDSSGLDVYASAADRQYALDQLGSISTKNYIYLQDLVNAGFDDITLKSPAYIEFGNGVDGWGQKIMSDVAVGRQLVLDSPQILYAPSEISSQGTGLVILQSPWITLVNDTNGSSSGQTCPGCAAHLELVSSGWLDVEGDINMAGFGEVNLEAARDIQFSNSLLGTTVFNGQLTTSGDLTLKASYVYPTTQYSYVVQSAGKVTVLPADNPVSEQVYSAGGSLTISAANGINVEGTLAAPNGALDLQSPDGRVYLAPGSLLTTNGGTAMVNYGLINLNNNGSWATLDASGNLDPVVLPGKSVTINANEVITAGTIDVSGGGTLFAYQWQAGTQGSNNPLTGVYVIMPDNAVQLPGPAVYLAGGAGLQAGVYSLLPAQYAFLPGAVVIEQQNVNITPGQTLVSSAGYPIIAGYSTVFGTNIQNTRPTAYSVMSASTALSQGDFTVQQQTMGNGGAVAVTGNSAIIQGQISAAAMSGYVGGKVSLVASNVEVEPGSAGQVLPQGFNFSTPLPAGLQGQLIVQDSSLYQSSSSGPAPIFQEIELGDPNLTTDLTIKAGSFLTAPVISLAANQQIAIEGTAELDALTQQAASSGQGVINLTTPNTLVIGQGSTLHATHNINMNANDVAGLQGTLEVDDSALTLKSTAIWFGPNGGSAPTNNGLYLTAQTWNTLANIDDITLISSSDIDFLSNFQLKGANSLTLDAGQIAGLNASGTNVTITAPIVNLSNSGGVPASTPAANGGTFTVSASQINVGSGDVLFGGFKTIALNSKNDFTLVGQGSLATGNADLQVQAARVVTAGSRSDGTYQAPAFTVVAGLNQNDTNPQGDITITSSTNKPSTTPGAGGMLELLAQNIELGTVLEVDGGTVQLKATGSGTDGVILQSGAQIIARGTASVPGGQVTLEADNGVIVMGTGSSIDVSAGTQGDAGLISLIAPVGGVTLGGTLSGKPGTGGAGGSFTLDTLQLSDADMTALILALNTGGFTGNLNITTQTGNIDILQGQTLTGSSIVLTANDNINPNQTNANGFYINGNINVNGILDAGGASGGDVELYSYHDLNVYGGISAAATSSGANGGNVLLSSETGMVNVNPGATINVSPGAGGRGGIVYVRAQQNGNDVFINLGDGITGASALYAEAVAVYSYNQPALSVSQYYSQWLSDAATFLSINMATARLQGAAPAGATFQLLPGIEVDNTGDIDVDTALNLTNLVVNSYGSYYPGVLTLRAGGNLNITQNLVDAPTTLNGAPPGRDSWGFNLVAGADTTSANYMATSAAAAARGVGDLNIGTPSASPVVYTESAPINFASALDTYIGPQKSLQSYMTNYMYYTLASYGGTIKGDVGRDLIIQGGAIQTAAGNIDINIGGNLNLEDALVGESETLGAIRTTGYASASTTSYWTYTGGGNINLDVGENVWNNGGTALEDNAWDAVTVSGGRTSRTSYWSASYSTSSGAGVTAGIATMGGGSVLVRTGGDFMSQAGTFGQVTPGDLIIYAGGDVTGRFLNYNGNVEINAAGNIGSQYQPQVIEAFTSRINVTAGGDIWLGTVLNPTIANPAVTTGWDLTYSPDTSAGFTAGGNITVTGTSPFYGSSGGNVDVLPATVKMVAGGDILLENLFAMAPSPDGNLTLIAGGNINGSYTLLGGESRSAIYMSDADPSSIYGKVSYTGTASFAQVYLFNPYEHGNLLHASDPAPVTVQAGGDIEDLELFLPKKAVITAGGNIQDLYYLGQNLNSGDVSLIQAGGDIIFNYLANSFQTGFEQDGPGSLIVEAGGSIDLGNSGGISSQGNAHNSHLSPQGSSVIILSGYSMDMTPEEAGTFFSSLQQAGTSYSELLAEGETAQAAQALQNTDTQLIYPLLGQPPSPAPVTGSTPPDGNIEMTSSQISTVSGQSNIYIIAKGAIDVGKSTFFSNPSDIQSTGIFTAAGGTINIYADGDVNVNQSRVMTFFGGDITVWSEYDGINAGYGSKAVVNALPPTEVAVWSPDNTYIIGYTKHFTPPLAGSGIRAVTYNPGPGYQTPTPGNIYAFAPRGTINAGEAGISGKNVVLGAVQVLNVQNITFSGTSVGVPVETEAEAGIGTLSGAGSVSAGATETAEETAGLTASNKETAEQMLNQVMLDWLDVKIIDLSDTE